LVNPDFIALMESWNHRSESSTPNPYAYFSENLTFSVANSVALMASHVSVKHKILMWLFSENVSFSGCS
jgi:hypothetical protein